jgi:hypothetical protein
MSPAVTIRPAHPSDRPALQRLAALDGRRPPNGDTVLAELERRRGCCSGRCDGHAVADPFTPTAHLVELLRRHAGDRYAPRRAHGLLTRLGLRHAAP